MSKPEVRGYEVVGSHDKHAHDHFSLDRNSQSAKALAIHWDNRGCIASVYPLIRLTDHEAAIAARDESVVKANAQAEHFEREWYLRGDALEAIESARAADKARMAELEQYNKSLDEENARLSADYGQACDDALSVARNLRTVEAERNELLGLLRQVYSDLPSRRDWLDPVIEAQIKDTLERHKC